MAEKRNAAAVAAQKKAVRDVPQRKKKAFW